METASNFGDLYNFAQVSPDLATSGLVPRGAFSRIASAGYAVVINLLPSTHRNAVADEAEVVAGLGMRYVHIPVEMTAPTERDFERFLEAMTEAEGARVWVHCAANYRVTSFVARYGRARLGWSREQAQALARRFWPPNEVWTAFAGLSSDEDAR